MNWSHEFESWSNGALEWRVVHVVLEWSIGVEFDN